MDNAFSHLLTGENDMAGNAFAHLATPQPPRQQDSGNPYIDFASSLGTGLAKGVVSLAGLPGDIQALARMATGRKNGPVNLPTSQQAIDYASQYIPSLKEKPQGTAGQYGETTGEFLALAGRRPIAFGIVPGVTSETAGQITKGTASEPYARLAGGIAGAGGSSLASLAARPSVAERTLATAARGMTPAQIQDAVSLFERSRQGANPVPLTLAEAAGNERMLNLQRVVEGQGGLSDFMAQRPGQVQAAGRAAIDTIAPQTNAPSMIGPQIGEAAQGTVKDVTDAINRRSRPLYQAAEPAQIDPQTWTKLQSDPLYMSVLKEVRSDPALNAPISNLPDNAVGTIDLVQRRMRERASNAAVPGQADTSNLRAAVFENSRKEPIQAANAATGSVNASPGQPATIGAYERARGLQEAMRKQYLEPLMAGPIGKLAEKDLTTKNAISVLFERNPNVGSANEITTAVSALSSRNPTASSQIVRQYLANEFNTAMKTLQGGMTQFGGAAFNASIKRNPQQAENLAAAINALPNGPQILAGFDKMLELMSATGRRQRIGSQTAFNADIQEHLAKGSTLGEAIATGGIKFPQMMRDAYQRWNMGKNVEEVANLLTDPQAVPVFKALANAPSGSSKAIAAATRLAIIAQSSNKKERK